jgi:hypothetical protein
MSTWTGSGSSPRHWRVTDTTMNGAGRSPINFHDQWAPELYDVGEGSNAFLFRGVVPYKLGGIAQLFRYTLPVVTAPDATGDTVTGLGDLNLIELFPFVLKRARMEIAVGPH